MKIARLSETNVVPLFERGSGLSDSDLLNLARANLLYAAADFCRAALECRDRDAVRLAQTVIIQIRTFGEETGHVDS